MMQLPVIFKRELASYFATPLAYVFIVIFLVLSGVFTFYLGGFYESGQASLAPFFANTTIEPFLNASSYLSPSASAQPGRPRR